MLICIYVEYKSGQYKSAVSTQVERDAWDEARLRALCARHGWEFEWMTATWQNESEESLVRRSNRYCNNMN